MKRALVHDANVLIDLVKLELIGLFFELPFRFITTDLIIEELLSEQAEIVMTYVDSGQFQVMSLTAASLLEVVDISARQKQLSLPDCSGIWLARQYDGFLLSGDRLLRKFSRDQGVEVHGHLWIFDRLVEMERLEARSAVLLLRRLCEEVNPKLGLPEKEVESRIKRWEDIENRS